MHIIRIRNNEQLAFEGKLPESWEEVSSKAFKAIFKLLFGTFPPLPTPELRLKLIATLLFGNKFRYTATMPFLSANDIYQISEKISFLWKSVSPIAFIKSFSFRFCRYYLPESYLANAVCIEFIYADNYLETISQYEGDINQCEELNYLVATLCRPRKWFHFIRKRLPSYDGDPRQRFNGSLMKRRAARFRKLPLKYKLYVLGFFIACKKDIVQDPAYNLVFPKSHKKSNPEQQGSDWAEVLKDVASTKLYGNYDETAYYNLHTMLRNMQYDNQRNKANKL